MPNYSLVIDSTFKPFTYQELIAPVKRMSDVHDQIAAQYDTYSDKSDVLEIMGNNGIDADSDSYKKYLSFSDQLRQEAASLQRHGLVGNSKMRLSNIRNIYNKEIVPIQVGWKKREDEAKEQQNAANANPSLMFTRTAAATSIDYYVQNPLGGYRTINGALITQQMSSLAEKLSKQVREGRVSIDHIDPYTRNIIEHNRGMTPEEINDWIAHPEKYPTLTNMRDQVFAANGVTEEGLAGSPNASDIYNKSLGFAQMGVWSAIGEDKSTIKDDPIAIMRAQTNESIRLEKAKAAIKAQQAAASGIPTITSDGIGIESTEHFVSTGIQELGKLKAGNNSFRASYFGKSGNVNPMAVYEEFKRQYDTEYRKAMNNNTENPSLFGILPGKDEYGHSITSLASTDFKTMENNIRKNVMAKYGVTDILSDTQYNLLKDMGYDNRHNIVVNGRGAFSDIEKKFNNLVIQKNRYSVNMTSYDNVGKEITGKLRELSAYEKLGGKLWPVMKDGKAGNPIKNADGLNLWHNDSKVRTAVDGLYYDPQFKGKIVFRISDGRRFVASPEIVSNELKGAIEDMEARGFDAQDITAAIYTAVNRQNKVQSNTDSDI